MEHLIAAAAALWIAAATAVGGHVETLDARRIDGDVTALTAQSVTVVADSKKHVIPRRDVAEIVFDTPKDSEETDLMARGGQIVVVTVGGDVIGVDELTLANDKWAIVSPLLGKAEIPISAVRTVYLPTQGTAPRVVRRQCETLKLDQRTQDVLVVAKEKGGYLAVEGVFKRIGEKTITFLWQETEREISRDKVRALRLAAAPVKTPATAGGLVGRDGSSVGFTSVTGNAESIVAEIVGVGRRTLPRKAVGALRFRSDRVAELADIKPASVKEYGFFDKTFPYRTGKAVGGGPIALDGLVYRTGLSLHSFCEQTYSLDGAYKTFVAVVGIDDAVRPAGDATLTFLGDGKLLGKPLRLTGRDKPHTVRLDIAGVRTFTVRVDFGADKLDVGDHVNLAAARLVK